MDEARLRSDMLGQVRQERDDVMLGLALDLVDPLDLPGAAFPDRLGGLLGDDAELGLRVAGVRLDLEPDAEAVFGRPDGDHVGAAVTRDHRGRSCRKGPVASPLQ